jgi:putative ABC transport system permease protein
MIHFWRLVLRNIGRSKLRTALTAVAVMVLVAVYSVQTTITAKVGEMINKQSSKTKLLVSERWLLPSEFPVRYIPQFVHLPGVADSSTWHLYHAYFDDSMQQDHAALGIATRPDNLSTMTQDLETLEPALVEAMKKEKTGVLMGSGVMEAMQWRVGDRFTAISSSHPGKDLEFKIVGVLPRGVWSPNFFFREDYYQEGTGDKEKASFVWLRLNSADDADRVASQIQEIFASQQPTLKVETESAGVARFARRSQIVFSIIELVVAVLLIDMVIILSNSISITTRERRVEMAILKVLGFEPWHIIALVIAEAMVVGALSGAIGGALACLLSDLGTSGLLPAEVTTFCLIFPMSYIKIAQGVAIGAMVGFAGSCFPAFSAHRVKVSDVFVRLA